jgi:hypothetical protein
MIVVPVTHDLIHVATVDTARLRLSLLDEVAEERGARPQDLAGSFDVLFTEDHLCGN